MTKAPYVLEEFNPDRVLIISNKMGSVNAIKAKLPPTVKMKAYREELRRKYFEALLSKRVLITEGKTEYDVYSTAARKLEIMDSEKYSSFERMGIALVNAETDTQIAPLGKYYKSLGKTVYAVCDKQNSDAHDAIYNSVDSLFEASEHGIEDMVLNGIAESRLKEYLLKIVEDGLWPKELNDTIPTEDMDVKKSSKIIKQFFRHQKGSGALADLIYICNEDEMPKFITSTISNIKSQCSCKSEEEMQVES